jgi:hypothetical protein
MSIEQDHEIWGLRLSYISLEESVEVSQAKSGEREE